MMYKYHQKIKNSEINTICLNIDSSKILNITRNTAEMSLIFLYIYTVHLSAVF